MTLTRLPSWRCGEAISWMRERDGIGPPLVAVSFPCDGSFLGGSTTSRNDGHCQGKAQEHFHRTSHQALIRD